MTRVVVADDHSLFRDGIVSLLQAADFRVVGQAGDGRAAVNVAMQTQPDLVLVDISMPETDGLQALREIKETLPQTRVVMLTVSNDEDRLLEALRGGADGYLLKDLSAEEFIQMLRGLEQGEVALTRKMSTRLIKRFARTQGTDLSANPALSQREVEILQHVSEGLSNKAIAHQLAISENTVKYHIKNILHKLDAMNRTEAVMQAMQAGLLVR